MLLDQALRLTSILLAAAAFIGLVLGARLPEWLTILTGAALAHQLLRLAGLPRLERMEAAVVVSPTTWNIFLVLAFLWFWADLFWISGELLSAGIHFLLVVMVIKLFNLQTRRDHFQLYAISLIALVAAAALTTDLWYVPIFLLYLVAGVWSLLLFQLTKEADGTIGASCDPLQPAAQAAPSRITPLIFWVANALALGTLCLTVAIFFAVPRTSAGFFQSGFGEGLRTSGFSDTVDLGTIGPIKRDPSVVMRVELPDRPPHEYDRLYLRGVAYDRYDGKSWMNRLTHRRVLTEPVPGTFTVRSGQRRSGAPLGSAIHLKVLLEALDTAVLFAAPFAESISGPFPSVQSDPTGALFLPFPSSSRIEYVALSRQVAAREAATPSHAEAYPESFARHFLQVPVESERVAALARAVVQHTSTPYERARAIESHLTRHYRYSLDIASDNRERPLDEFLFNRKTGYCEHYATAMVVMLRAIGIPARLVTGFLASEWNEYGNYYVVRQRDAHAWVEVYLPDSGWVTMDPTPSVTELSADSGWSVVGRMVDMLRLKWNRVFVQYNAADQLALVQELKAGTTSVKNQAWDSTTAFVKAGVDVLMDLFRRMVQEPFRSGIAWLGLVLSCVGTIAWLLWNRLWSTAARLPAASVSESRRIAQLYQKMIAQLARKGMGKPATATPLEFLRTIQHDWSIASTEVAVMTELYCRARFGQALLTPDEFARAEASLREVSKLRRLTT